MRFNDYPELTKNWTRQLCTLGKFEPFRLAVYTTEVPGHCHGGEDGTLRITNPYLPSDRNIYLTGYYPLLAYEEKGALKLKKGHVTVLTGNDTNLIQKFGSQLESQYYVVVLDLSSEQIASSGSIETWTRGSSSDVDLVYIVGSPPLNYFEFINQIIDSPETVPVLNAP